MMRRMIILSLTIILWGTTAVSPTLAQEKPAVYAIMFWMEGCGHCTWVKENVLPPLAEKYGDQWQLELIELRSAEDFDHLFALGTSIGVPREAIGVPFLLIGDAVLIGSGQIPDELPGLIEQHLAAGGVGWPTYPALAPLLPEGATPPGSPTASVAGAPSADAVVQAVLFSTPDCHDCQLIIAQALVPLREQYGAALQVQNVDIVTSEDVTYLYQVAAEFGLSQEQVDLPMLIIGEHILIDEQISAELPGLIEQYLAAGGVGWPVYPALADLLPEDDTCPDAAPCPGVARSLPPVYTEAEAQEADALTRSLMGATEPSAQVSIPVAHNGFRLAIVILAGMVLALGYTAVRLWHVWQSKTAGPAPDWIQVVFPLLAVVGLGVAAYLAYVETQAVTAVCGPVGDCNAVQTSEYAYLFGIPIGVWGVLGYVAILAAWGWGRWQADHRAALALAAMTAFGVLFSIYLTYLEPFVIGAVCAWCLTSSVVMTLLMLVSVETAVPHIRLAANGKR